MKLEAKPPANAEPLKLFSAVIPARDEEESLPSTIEHLHLEFSLSRVPHEIVVVDDGSQDRTWEVLQQLKANVPGLRPIQNTGEHGFGRAVVIGLRHSQGGRRGDHDGRRIRRRARRSVLLEIAE
jgi:dolichol-phosphate mannosyltransferase